MDAHRPRLLEALRGLLPAALDSIASVRVDRTWPVAVAHCERVERGPMAWGRYDVASDGAVTPRPPGPRRAEHEPPIKLTDWWAPEPLRLEIDGSDIWRQCLEVVESRILGTTEAAEHRISEPGGDSRYYCMLVGHGRPRSEEREAWILGTRP